MAVTRSQSQAARRARPTLENLPLELRTRIQELVCTRGPIIIRFRGTREKRVDESGDGPLGRQPAAVEDLEASVMVVRRVLVSLQRACRLLYHEMTPRVMEFPLQLRVDSGIRMTTALDMMGTQAAARIGDLQVNFHDAWIIQDQTEGYYNHFFDLSHRDIGARLPGLTKLMLVAPVDTMQANAVRHYLMRICFRFAISHPTVRQYREVPAGPTTIKWEITV